MKQLIENDKMWNFKKNERGLYDVEYLEYSIICKCWYKVSYSKNYTKEAIKTLYDVCL